MEYYNKHLVEYCNKHLVEYCNMHLLEYCNKHLVEYCNKHLVEYCNKHLVEYCNKHFVEYCKWLFIGGIKEPANATRALATVSPETRTWWSRSIESPGTSTVPGEAVVLEVHQLEILKRKTQGWTGCQL